MYKIMGKGGSEQLEKQKDSELSVLGRLQPGLKILRQGSGLYAVGS